METDERYHLKWEKHQESLDNTFQALRRDGHFCDVTIACDEKAIEAHKLVLSATSSVFNTILKKHSHPHPFIYLKGAKAVDMDAMVEFMYCGEVKVRRDQLKSFIETAEEFRLQGLCQGAREEKINWPENKKICPNPDSTSSLRRCDVKDEILEEQGFGHSGRSSKSSPDRPPSKARQLGKLKSLIDNFLGGQVTLAEEVKEYKDLEKFVARIKDGKYGSGARVELQCMLCGSKRKNKNHLLEHIEGVHFSKVLNNKCKVCGKRSSTKQGLLFHLRKIHGIK